jgi:DNA-binding NarL/FixJ family response regulator
MSSPFKIALLDDHAIVRVGYRRLLELEPGLQVVAEYADAESASFGLNRLADADIDLLVLDLSLPGRSGLDFLRELRQERPRLKVLVVSMHDSPAIQHQCLRAGACGVVAKSSDPEALVDAVRRLQHGQEAPGVAAALRRARQAPHEQLTARELQVMQHLLAGRGVDEAAARMGVSEKTVFNYQTLLRQKLSVASTMGLVHYAQAHGLMPG